MHCLLVCLTLGNHAIQISHSCSVRKGLILFVYAAAGVSCFQPPPLLPTPPPQAQHYQPPPPAFPLPSAASPYPPHMPSTYAPPPTTNPYPQPPPPNPYQPPPPAQYYPPPPGHYPPPHQQPLGQPSADPYAQQYGGHAQLAGRGGGGVVGGKRRRMDERPLSAQGDVAPDMSKFRTKKCAAWQAGKPCRYGDKCTFIHDQ